MVVEKPYKNDERESGIGTAEALDHAASMAKAMEQVGANFAKAFEQKSYQAQPAEEVPRTNRQESFGKLFRKKGRRW